MKRMTANFFPASEQKNGYLGKANLTIGNAIRLNGISVFYSSEKDAFNIAFPEYGDGASYVVPKSKEMYAAMLEVVSLASVSDKKFAFLPGDYGVHMEVTGRTVNEPYADGRFFVEVDDICTLYGITTKEVEYVKEGKDRSFTAVDLPTIGTYEKDGETQYQTAFEGRISSWKDRDGKEQSINYGQLLQGKVLAEYKALVQERKPALEDQVRDANSRKGESSKKNTNGFEVSR